MPKADNRCYWCLSYIIQPHLRPRGSRYLRAFCARTRIALERASCFRILLAPSQPRRTLDGIVIVNCLSTVVSVTIDQAPMLCHRYSWLESPIKVLSVQIGGYCFEPSDCAECLMPIVGIHHPDYSITSQSCKHLPGKTAASPAKTKL